MTDINVDIQDGATMEVEIIASGPPGLDGISPTIETEDITGGHRLIITDAAHPGGQTVDVMDGAKGDPGEQGEKGDKGDPGEDGQDGAPGRDGTDGVSPEVTITSISGGHTVTITDAAHPSGQSFDVMDGAKGDTGGTGPQGEKGDKGDTGATGATGATGQTGATGADGTTFTPAVSSAGVISWTNDGEKQNPTSVDLVAAVLAALPTWSGGSY